MRIDFLGTGAGNYRGSRRQPCSALLDGVLLDCGAGATGRLHDLHRFDGVDAVLITHLHTDHVAGLFDLLLHTIITGRSRPLTILSPPGLRAILGSLFAARSTVVDPSERYDLRLLEGDRPEATVGRWAIRSVPLEHSVLDLGFELKADGLTVFYTGDTREPCAAHTVRADVLIHEATYPDHLADQARAFGHSTPSDAAAAAVAMRAGRLLINHVGDQADAESEVLRAARAVFPETEVTEDRTHFEL